MRNYCKRYRNQVPVCCSSKLRSQAAFTLVELLVVVAIIGILIGMLLPAVQQVREAARRTVCMSNSAQLGLATHNYEFATERLPEGSINPKGPIVHLAKGQHVSFLVQLLPYIEQRAVADNFDISLGTYAPANAKARLSHIPIFACPSSGFGMLNIDEDAALANYAGCHHGSEAQIDEDNNGLLFLNSKVTYTDIYDGSSNTILIGESEAYADSLGWASGTRSSLRNTGEILSWRDWASKITGLVVATDVGGFAGRHPGGVVFCMGDGSIQFINHNIDPIVFGNLGNRSDGAMLGNWDW